MNKILAMMAVIVMIPHAALAETVISDSRLRVITGQPGGQFSVSEIQREDIDIGIISFADKDGKETDFFVYPKEITAGSLWPVYPPSVTGQDWVKLTMVPEIQREDIILAEFKFRMGGEIPSHDIDVGVISFGDEDGAVNPVLDPASAAGFFGFKNVKFKNVTNEPDWSAYPFLQPMTVSVIIAEDGSIYDVSNGVFNPDVHARIGLGTRLVKIKSYDADVVISNNADFDNGTINPANTAQTLRSIHIKDLSMTTGANSFVTITVNR